MYAIRGYKRDTMVWIAVSAFQSRATSTTTDWNWETIQAHRTKRMFRRLSAQSKGRRHHGRSSQQQLLYLLPGHHARNHLLTVTASSQTDMATTRAPLFE